MQVFRRKIIVYLIAGWTLARRSSLLRSGRCAAHARGTGPWQTCRGRRGEPPLKNKVLPPHGVCGGSINERDMKPMLSKFYFLLLSIQFSILKPGMRLKCFTLSVTRMRSSCSAVAPIIRSMLSMRCPARSSCQRMSPYSRMQ